MSGRDRGKGRGYSRSPSPQPRSKHERERHSGSGRSDTESDSSSERERHTDHHRSSSKRQRGNGNAVGWERERQTTGNSSHAETASRREAELLARLDQLESTSAAASQQAEHDRAKLSFMQDKVGQGQLVTIRVWMVGHALLCTSSHLHCSPNCLLLTSMNMMFCLKLLLGYVRCISASE